MLGRSSIPVALYPQLAMGLAAVLAVVAYPQAPLVRERFYIRETAAAFRSWPLPAAEPSTWSMTEALLRQGCESPFRPELAATLGI